MLSGNPTDLPQPQKPNQQAMPNTAHTISMVYRIARRLESYSFAAAPEQLAVLEGLRAAVAVASLVALAVWLDWPTLSWAAFGAFWTCLADPGGPDRRRLACMGCFAAAGAIAAFGASLSADAGAGPAGATLLALTFLTGLSGTYGPAAAQVGTLAAVVAVVAVAFPQPPQGAIELSATFLLGSVWALVLCIGIWRIHPYAAARRALGAVYQRLGDMTHELLLLDRQDTTGHAVWSRSNAEHRRAVRTAIERARSVILGLENGTGRYSAELDTADRIFAALIAIGHDRGSHDAALTAGERGLVHRLLLLLVEARHQTAQRTPQTTLLGDEAAALGGASAATSTVTGHALVMAARALCEQADSWRRGTADATAAAKEGLTATAGFVRSVPAVILRHAARISVAVLTSYALAEAFQLHFSYWATMATVVVVQPFAPVTWPRCLERMLGSIAGGGLAALTMLTLRTPLDLLPAIFPIATATIALRRVNYSLFVMFLTSLFVLVAELLQPSSGIAASRVINNIIGSVVGAAAGLVLWPERGSASQGTALAEAVAANLAYARQVIAAEPASAGFDAARRAAGVASTAAETMCHRLMLAGQWRRAHLSEAVHLLQALRELAGVATAYGQAGCQPDPVRAAALFGATHVLIAAVRNNRCGPDIPMPSTEPPDEIAAAIRNVTQAAAAYAAASRPRPGPAQPAAAHSRTTPVTDRPAVRTALPKA